MSKPHPIELLNEEVWIEAKSVNTNASGVSFGDRKFSRITRKIFRKDRESRGRSYVSRLFEDTYESRMTAEEFSEYFEGSIN